MALLERHEWYDIARSTNWTPKYVQESELFPDHMTGAMGVPMEQWEAYDEPYKTSYPTNDYYLYYSGSESSGMARAVTPPRQRGQCLPAQGARHRRAHRSAGEPPIHPNAQGSPPPGTAQTPEQYAARRLTAPGEPHIPERQTVPAARYPWQWSAGRCQHHAGAQNNRLPKGRDRRPT
mgnify:CR=1 FL=1